MLYLREPLQDSYPSESPILAGNVMMYMNFSSASTGEFSEFLSSISESWRDSRNHEMMLMDQMGSRNVQGQGLSLSLSSHIPPTGIQFYSGDYRNPNIFFRPESSSMMPNFHGSNLDSIKTDVSPYGIGNVLRGITDSKYLKSAQKLLDEIVNVGKALKQQNSRKESTEPMTAVCGSAAETTASYSTAWNDATTYLETTTRASGKFRVDSVSVVQAFSSSVIH
ncbi:hypothetical protein L2E82_37137 [Cichorium intybus]|uniref:Uncharacterized protein n=1 Tax=Cichorium intybus TaxID=13427 RepID=A0ACB9AEL9_CICIN|nr:hypothetical protein L2E82_37137 [Cichorium intybus]